jgi:hypothetical protein
MTPAQKTRGIFLIVGLYVVIAVVGFFVVYFIKKTYFPISKTAPTPIVTVSKVTKTALPANWKTYKDPTNGISFSYPGDLKLKASSYQFGVSNVEMRSADNTDPNNSADYQLLVLPKTLAMAAGQDFDSYYNAPNNTTKPVTSPLSNKKTQQNFTKIDNRIISGHQAFDYRSSPQNASANSEAEVGVFIEDGNNLILISAGESSKDELDQILQTFQLTK